MAEPPLRAQLILIIPPALKKYRSWFTLGNVIVFEVVALDVHALVVVVVAVLSVPEAAALSLVEPVTADTFELRAVNADIVPPALGFVIDVIDDPWCAAALVIGLSKLAHCVAEIVDPALTAETADCPYPFDPEPVDHIVLTLSLNPL